MIRNRKFSLAWGSTLVLLVLVISSTSSAVTYKVLHTFTGGSGGGYPVSGLISDAAGNLYGTTDGGGAYGAGTVFKLAPNPDGTWTHTVLHSFADYEDGSLPDWSYLVFDNQGNLYGTTYGGGNIGNCGYGHGCGTAYKLTPNPDGTWTESVLHAFGSGTDGRRPQAALVLDKVGNVYGTTTEGGFYGGGTVFVLVSNSDGSWTETILHNFGKQRDGVMPWTGVVFDADVNSLYGTTRVGGIYGLGTIFKLTPNPDGTWTENILHNFKGARDGSGTYAGVVFDTAGNLYGVSLRDGTYDKGTIYSMSPLPGDGWTGRTLHQFTGGEDGGNPTTRLIVGWDGNLYGMASNGGRGTCQDEWGTGCGVVFKMTPATDGKWTGTVLHRFRGESGGGSPYGGPLVLDAAGNIYGTAWNRGARNYGVVFQITP